MEMKGKLTPKRFFRWGCVVVGITGVSVLIGSMGRTNDSSPSKKVSGTTFARSDSKGSSAGVSKANAAPPIEPVRSRVFDFVYTATVQPSPNSRKGAVDLFLPLARDTERQEILQRQIDAPIEGKIQTETTYQNQYWHAKLTDLPSDPLTITVKYRVKRKAHLDTRLETGNAEQSRGTALDRERYDLFLKPNRRVPVEGPLIEEHLNRLNFTGANSKLAMAREIFQHVVDVMEYKKVGTGWGKGDTYWACTKGYGNCTDFHALFTSLARNRGVPVKFKIGFPVPIGRSSGEVDGYHCWLNVALPGKGWLPIDASEAKKHPKLRDFLFGNQLPDRIVFTRGRDLELGSNHDTGPLNYFIYPHVEIGDEEYDDVSTSFSFTEVSRGQ